MAATIPPSEGQPLSLETALSKCRSAFFSMAVFSFFINVLVLATPLYMFQVLDRVLGTGNVETLILLTAMTLGAVLVMTILETLRASISTRIGEWLNDKLGPHYLDSASRAQSAGGGEGVQPLRDLAQIEGFISNQGLIAFFDSPWVPVFVILIWMMHPILGAVALTAALLLFALSIANNLITRKATETAIRARRGADRVAEVTIRNAEVVRAMGILPDMVRHWQGFNKQASSAMRRAAETGGILLGATKLVRNAVQVLILGFGAWLVVGHEISTGGMIAGSILLGRALAPVEMAIGGWKSFITAKEAYNRLKEHGHAFPPEPVRTELPKPVGRLDVQDLTYAAPYNGQVILNGISFSIDPGDVLAVVGASGAGKSTLCRMLVGLIAPAAGEVRLDGSELKNWPAIQRGSHIGYLPQEVELFPGTVRQNIARMSEASSEAVIQAALNAQAHRMIQRLPEGYDTEIGDGGVRLSGGQRQRIGLARALFGTPSLIVLDEPNANLDHVGESALGQSIEELRQDGTTFVIVGHRPSTITMATKILVLQDGCLVMFGNRDDVLETIRDLPAEHYIRDTFPVRLLPRGPVDDISEDIVETAHVANNAAAGALQ